MSTERTVYSNYDTGRSAAEMPMDQITGTGAGPRTFVLSTELVVRGSLAPPTGVPYEAA